MNNLNGLNTFGQAWNATAPTGKACFLKVSEKKGKLIINATYFCQVPTIYMSTIKKKFYRLWYF